MWAANPEHEAQSRREPRPAGRSPLMPTAVSRSTVAHSLQALPSGPPSHAAPSTDTPSYVLSVDQISRGAGYLGHPTGRVDRDLPSAHRCVSWPEIPQCNLPAAATVIPCELSTVAAAPHERGCTGWQPAPSQWNLTVSRDDAV
jgi:hypothetical protein